MRIALFCYGFDIGGVERLFVCLGNALLGRGHCVQMLVSRPQGAYRKDVNCDIEVIKLSSRVRHVFFPLLKYLDSHKPDVLLVGHDFPCVMAALVHLFSRGKTKLVLSQHSYFNVDMQYAVGVSGWFVRQTMRILYNRADRVIAVSDGIRSFLIEHGIKSEIIIRIYNPVDGMDITAKSIVDDDSLQKVYEKFGRDPYIIFLGRMTKVKNLDLLVQAFAQVHDLHNTALVFVGDGDDRGRIEELVDSMGLTSRVLFMGALSNPYPLLSQSAMLVLTSFSEALPTVVIEALHFGKPVISTPTGAVEILGNGRVGKIMTSFENDSELARLMEMTLKELHDGGISTEVLHARANDFSMEIALNQYEGLFSKLIS